MLPNILWLVEILFLLAHLAKGKVSFCHHLASVVCRPLTCHILISSSETPQPNELYLGRFGRGLLEEYLSVIQFIEITAF
jgi:hypothetical protein